MVDAARIQNILYISGAVLVVIAVAIGIFIIWPTKPDPEEGTRRLDAYLDTPSATLIDDPSGKKEHFGSGSPIGCPNNYSLCDYYMASSGLSMYSGKSAKDYIYSESISKVVKAGARLVDLHIYDVDKKPVVGYANAKGTMYSYNTIPFEECCLAIANTAFSEETPGSRNPFVLSLMFHTHASKIMKSCADTLKTTLVRFMLNMKYGYGRLLSTAPICDLMGSLIIVTGPETDNTAMAELANMVWGRSHLRRVEYTKAAQTYTVEDDKEYNRLNITLVVPDEDKKELTNGSAEVCHMNGCQWVAMNYGSFELKDKDPMNMYIGKFSESPFVLKPQPLRKKIVPEVKVVQQDPALALRPLKKDTPIMNLSIAPVSTSRLNT
jgi:hypothetical protein